MKIEQKVYELNEKPNQKVIFASNQVHENVTVEEADEKNKNLIREKSLLVVILNSKSQIHAA